MPIRLQDVLLPLAAGAASTYSPRAGRAISGGLQGMLAIKENERRDKEEERRLSLQERQQAQQEQMFAIQLGEAQARADQRNREAFGWKEIGSVFGEKVPDGVYRQRDASGAEQDWVPTREEQAAAAEDPALYEAEQNRRAAAIAAKQGMAREAIEFKRQARDISEQSQRRLSDVYRESRADNRMREQIAAQEGADRNRHGMESGLLSDVQWGVGTDGKPAVVTVTRGGAIKNQSVGGFELPTQGGTNAPPATTAQKQAWEKEKMELEVKLLDENLSKGERAIYIKRLNALNALTGTGNIPAKDLKDFYDKTRGL